MIRACVLRLFRNTFRSSPLGNYREYVRDTSLERTANRYRLWGARSVAGQLIGALVFLVESAPKGHENLFGSLAFASGNAGTMLGDACRANDSLSLSESSDDSLGGEAASRARGSPPDESTFASRS